MAEAEERLRRTLAEEATCPICLGYFAEPVSVQCGHTFCTPCIARYWEGVRGPYPCPQCRETAPTSTLRPNRHLASIVQILAQGPPVAPPGEGPHMCTEHDEKLKLFCQKDQIPICVICRESRDHRAHTVTPIMEAAREYKVKFQSHLNDVKRQLEKVLGLQIKEEGKLTDLQEKFKIQKEQTRSVFDQVQQFLEKEKCRHLSNLEEEETRVLQLIKEKVSNLCSKQMLLRNQITEIESKCQQPDVELLKDVKSLLASHHKDIEKETKKKTRQQKGENEVEKEEMKEMGKENDEVEEDDEEGDEEEQEAMVEDLLMKITESLEWRWARRYAGQVTLDPVTAHWSLIISEDRRSVRRGDTAQILPDTPKRYNTAFSVLGSENLRSGRYYWEVEVGDKTRWKLGVCDDSASRKGAITASPERGYWVVQLRDGEYKALSSPSTPLTPSVSPRVVGLFLDYEAGRFSMYNVTDRSLLFTFSGVSFARTLWPFFNTGPREGGKNVAALRVLPAKEEE